MEGGPAPPAHLEAEHAAWEWRVASQYGTNTLTYRLYDGAGASRFLKLRAGDTHPTLADERERMEWAGAWLPVPSVLDAGSEGDVHWLLTAGLPGSDATDSTWKADPERLVRTLARGLRVLHAAPVGSCPFDFTLPAALGHVKQRLDSGQILPARDFHPEFEHLSAADAVRLLEATRPTSEDPVVCHGDYCLPNIIIDGWEPCGFVDLGELGVADRWWDLSVATWSLTWNLGPGYEELFLAEYGIEPDLDRIRYFRLLYDLVS